MTTPPPHEHDNGYERLIMFTDGIFAIAITLLALEIRVPDITNRAELGQAIIDLLPQIFVFVYTFIQVGIFWLAHQRMFRYIARTDDRFMVLCVLYLMVIAFLPVPSAILARYGDQFPAVEFFAVTMLLVGVMEFLIWEYAVSNHRLVRPEITPLQITEQRWRTVNLIIIFSISIVIAFVSPLASMLFWFLLFVTRRLISWRFNRLTVRSSAGHKAA